MIGRVGHQLNRGVLIGVFVIVAAGLLLGLDAGTTLVTWASFLGAIALVMGVLNLLAVHLRRAVRGNVNSIVLVLGIAGMLAMPLADTLGLTVNGAEQAFALVQAPLESALAALTAFFLLFGGMRLLRRERRGWSLLFLISALLVLLGSVPLPAGLAPLFGDIRRVIDEIVVNAGMRGILLGIALGTITMSLRLLTGIERPYEL